MPWLLSPTFIRTLLSLPPSLGDTFLQLKRHPKKPKHGLRRYLLIGWKHQLLCDLKVCLSEMHMVNNTWICSRKKKNQFLSAAPSPQALTVCILNAAKTIKQNPSFWLLCLTYVFPLAPKPSQNNA